MLIAADLCHANFRNAELGGAKLMLADLCHAVFDNAKLPRAYLSDANLQDCSLKEASLTRTYLAGVNLDRAVLDKGDLSAANLLHSYWKHTSAIHAYLNRAYVNDVDLDDANLTQADLRAADLTQTNLSNAVVEATRFGDNRGLSQEARQALLEGGAVFLSSLNESNESSADGEILREDPARTNPHHLIERFRMDASFRLLDLKEAVFLVRESLNVFQAAIESKADGDITYQTCEQLIEQLHLDVDRMQQNLEGYEDILPHHSEGVMDEELWASQDLSGEFDHLHEQALLVGKHIRLIHALWKGVDVKKNDPYYINQQANA